MGLQNSEGLVSLDTRVGIPLGNQKKKKEAKGGEGEEENLLNL